jgi:hypothetical protein
MVLIVFESYVATAPVLLVIKFILFEIISYCLLQKDNVGCSSLIRVVVHL